MTPAPTYTAVNGMVHHKSGVPLPRADCERIQQYLNEHLANPNWSEESQAARRQDLAALELAMAASFVEQKAAAE